MRDLRSIRDKIGKSLKLGSRELAPSSTSDHRQRSGNAAPNLSAEKLKSRALFIVARDDANDGGPRLSGIRVQCEKAPKPKELIVVDGSGHAQFLFQPDQSDRVMARSYDSSRRHERLHAPLTLGFQKS